VGGNNPNGDSVKAAVQTSIKILQDANGALYVDPDAQHYSRHMQHADLLSIYSREIEALRLLIYQLVQVCTRYGELLQGDVVKPVDLITLGEINNYLAAASWNITLLLDPESFRPLPDQPDLSVNNITK